MTGIGVFLVASLFALLLVLAAVSHLLREGRLRWALIGPLWLAVAWVGYDLGYRSWVEEKDIQSRVAELCKDAGVRIMRKVAAEGFYDDTTPNAVGSPSKQAVDSFETRGFRFYEYRFDKRWGEPDGVIHIEKNDGTWTASHLPQPRARFHLKRIRSDEPAGHKIAVTESVMLDTHSGEIIGREMLVKSLPNKVDLWWMARLGSPTRYCPPYGGERARGSLWQDAVVPLK